ncbi:MAG: hypothetical protein JXQ79_02980 [Rhodobacteraceae bacterium]|nr:hypothetical protein [Paracoccaceae bacterium]
MFQFGTADASQSMMLRRMGAQLKNNVSKLTTELSSGQHLDKPRALNGALAHLAHIEHGLRLSARHIETANFLSTIVSAQQEALGRLGEITQTLALDFQISKQGPDSLVMSDATARARDGFADVIGLLNTKVAGRHLFSGAAGDQRPYADPDVILNALLTSLPATSSTADIRDHVQAWFAEGGGFDTIAYLGGAEASTGIDLGGGVSVQPGISGADPALRKSLAGLALGAIGEALTPRLSAPERRSLLDMSAEALFGAEASRIALAAQTGAMEARIDEAKTRAQSTGATLEIARTELLAADPYQTATALEAATQRLDALYLVTARLSRLSLTEYMR